MYAEVSDAHTAHPSEITLPDPPRIPKDIVSYTHKYRAVVLIA